MRANRYARLGLTLAAAAAILATAALGIAASGPIAAAATGARLTRSGTTTPGWRVVKTIGPPDAGVSGLLTAVSAKDAWSVWSGAGFTAVEHWTGSGWARVPLPARLDAYAQSTVSVGASSASDVWLFGTHRTTGVLRWTGGRWELQAIPSWVLRRDSTGTVTATSAVFSPGNVWVFSLGTGAYAAHYNGRAWAKVKLPAVPVSVSAVAPGDIWALGPNINSVMYWNGKKWGTIRLPVLPLPKGATVSYSNMTAVGPKNAWLFRSISLPSSSFPLTATMHWNGKSWITVGSPADIVGSMAPDGRGGLWADGIDINPGGFWLLYHLAAGRWTEHDPPAGVFTHSPTPLIRIPGTGSLWATATTVSDKGFYGAILKYGP